MTDMSDVLVRVRDLRKSYGSIRAVDGISFEVSGGDILGFLGPNGAGKTTAMKLITGFLEPDGGTVVVAGHDVGKDPLAAQRRIGYLPENAPAYGEMTVDGFLRFIADARAVVDAERAIDRVVEMTALKRVRHQTIETLSKGFKRRVGLAQAMIHDLEVLILDEPTDGLDPNQRVLVQDLLRDASHHTTVNSRVCGHPRPGPASIKAVTAYEPHGQAGSTCRPCEGRRSAVGQDGAAMGADACGRRDPAAAVWARVLVHGIRAGDGHEKQPHGQGAQRQPDNQTGGHWKTATLRRNTADGGADPSPEQ